MPPFIPFQKARKTTRGRMAIRRAIKVSDIVLMAVVFVSKARKPRSKWVTVD